MIASVVSIRAGVVHFLFPFRTFASSALVGMADLLMRALMDGLTATAEGQIPVNLVKHRQSGAIGK